MEVCDFFADDKNEYYYTLTIWQNEDVKDYKNILGNDLYINYIEYPNKDMVDNFLRSGKTEGKNLVNYHRQLYMRYRSIETLEEIKKILNIRFDVVVLVRTDTKIWENISIYYNLVKVDDNSVFVPDGPNSSVFGSHINDPNSACPDFLYFSNEDVMFKLLNQLNLSYDTKTNDMYHPETSQMNFFKLLGLNIVRLPFDVFTHPRLNENGKLEAVHYPRPR